MFPEKNPPPQTNLNPADQSMLRRRQMLTELQAEVTACARRRRTAKRTIPIALLFVVIGGVWWTSAALLNRTPELQIANETPFNPYSVNNVLVGNQSDVIQKYVVSNADIVPSHVQMEDVPDESLQQMLAENGKDLFVARVENRLVLWEPTQEESTISN